MQLGQLGMPFICSARLLALICSLGVSGLGVSTNVSFGLFTITFIQKIYFSHLIYGMRIKNQEKHKLKKRKLEYKNNIQNTELHL
jgi:hypothetical protein